MATAAVSNTFTNGSNADAVQVNSNFTSLVNFLNTQVITKDAAIAFTAIPSGPATNPTSDNQFTRKYYVDNLTPAGVISAYGGATAPSGYVVCDGNAISRTNTLYVRLFAAIGTRYGVGDGSTTFNVPNLVGKFPYGHGTSATVVTAGAATVTLTTANLAAHVHNISAYTHSSHDHNIGAYTHSSHDHNIGAYTHTAPTVTQPVLSNHADHNHTIYALPTTSAGGHDHDVYTSSVYAVIGGSPIAATSYVTSSSSSPDPSTSSVSGHVHTVSGYTLNNATALSHSFSTAVAVAATAQHNAKDTDNTTVAQHNAKDTDNTTVAQHNAKDTDSAGSATPFSILPPYQSVMYIIKL